MVKHHIISIQTKGKSDLVDITTKINALLGKCEIANGMVLVFVPGSTGALSTIEYEPGLMRDFPILMEKLIPERDHYYHNETWHDGNGYSHLRATVIGPSLTVPLKDRELLLGTWQQIVFCEFDNRPRHRQVIVHIMGE